MVLPPALLARLQKRGIIKTANEEVIAENYDSSDGKEKKLVEESIAGAPGCPNKFNPYHVCSQFCYTHWKDGTPENKLLEGYQRKRRRMLGKFPLPEGWVEVYDAGIRRHYYWNQDTDEVCWVSPRHPRAVIGEPAPRVAKELMDRMNGTYVDRSDIAKRTGTDSIHNPPKAPSSFGGKKRKNESDDSGSDSDDVDRAEWHERDKLKRAKRKGIDPMDPAAYGEAPVGKWSAGLHTDDKTGADVTASGPLFQQRPYPAPGAILRQNKRREEDDHDWDW